MATNRRKFIIRSAAGVAGASLIGPQALAAETRLAEDEPIAMALGYKIDANDVDVTRFPKRAGEEGAKQFCDNCGLYQARADGYGTCSAIPGKLVAGAGWCNAWVPVS